MSAIPIPEGTNVPEMIRRLRAIDAEIFGTLFAREGVISGGVSIAGDLGVTDIISESWDGALPLDLEYVDPYAAAGYALDSSEGSMQIMGDLFFGDNLKISDQKIEFGTEGDTFIDWTGSYISIQAGYVKMGNPGARVTAQQISNSVIMDFGLNIGSTRSALGGIVFSDLQSFHEWNEGPPTDADVSMAGAIRSADPTFVRWMSDEFVQGVDDFYSSLNVAWIDGITYNDADEPSRFGWAATAFRSKMDTHYRITQQVGSEGFEPVMNTFISDENYFGVNTIYGQTQFSPGSAAVPSMSFINDEQVGFWRASGDTLGFAAKNVNQMSMAAGDDSTRGIATLTIHSNATGENMLKFGTDRPWYFRQYNTGSGTELWLQDGGSSKNFVIVDYNGNRNFVFAMATANPQLLMLNGTVSKPALSFISDTNTGIYHSATDQMTVTTGSNVVFSASANQQIGSGTGLTGSMMIESRDVGTVGQPIYSFYNDLNNGLRWRSTDNIGLVAGGADRLILSTTQFIGPRVYLDTISSAPTVVVSSNGRMRRATSALKYKRDVSYDTAWLADIVLAPITYTGKGDNMACIGFAADDLGAQDVRLGLYDDEYHDEIEDFDNRSVMAVMAAKINRLEAEMKELRK